MSNKNTVYVRLKDKGTIFHDASQDKSVTGAAIEEFTRTEKVSKAIRSGVLVEVSEVDVKKAQPAPKQEQKPGPEDEKEKGNPDADEPKKGVSLSGKKGK